MQIEIRTARDEDLPTLGRMGGALARLHHAFDPERFMLVDGVEAGYQAWFKQELRREEVVLLVAVRDGAVLGYAYGRVEERDWNVLLDRCGGFHDLWVEPEARTGGAGRLLAEALLAAFQERGVPRVVLHAAAKNEAAQRLFARLGWRPTMIEMTRELPSR